MATLPYKFSFAWDSPYGHVVQLIERLGLQRGVVIDLGCGLSAVAEPLRERDYEYVGMDIDHEALTQLSQSGFEAHEIDLRHTKDLADRLLELAGGRRVAAVLLLDVLEHMPETQPFLLALRAAMDALGRPPLLVSVPNVAHVDVGAKLVFGRWDYMRTGLLDKTHLQFFTDDRLHAETRACGLLEVGSHDFQLRVSDQRFPTDHPALSEASPIAQTIRMWRKQADPHGQTVQFIRALMACDIDSRSLGPDPREASAATTFLTVVMRTQGTRPANLREALTCLAAQTFDNFDVLLMVHSEAPETALSAVKALVEEFDPVFASRVRVVHVSDGSRGRPLNAALELLRSDYVAFLDDDDLVMANWVESFFGASGAGVIVRSVGAVRQVSASPEPHKRPYVIESSLEFRYDTEFDPIHHLWGNETPICTFAVPCSLIETFGLRFDEQLAVLEDWDFLMRCVALAPVRDTREVTSIYQMWRRGESSASLHNAELWQATQRVLQDRANLRPIVLPAGSVARLIDMCQQLSESDLARIERDGALAEVVTYGEEARRRADEAEHLSKELESLRRDYLITINSRRWRLLGPPARAVRAVRRLGRRTRNLFRSR
jgi:hypothetical protein